MTAQPEWPRLTVVHDTTGQVHSPSAIEPVHPEQVHSSKGGIYAIEADVFEESYEPAGEP